MQHSYSADPRRKQRSPASIVRFAALLLATAVILPMTTTTTRIFSRPLFSCHAWMPKITINLPATRSHRLWLASPTKSRRTCSFYNPTHNNNNRYASRQQPNYSTTRLLASRSKSTYSKSYSLVVKGPPGFTYPGHDRPFKLVIVESPSKCETISKILQEYVKEKNLQYDFVLTSSLGHIRDLPKKKTDKSQTIAGIDLENDYSPTYVVLDGKEGLLRDLEELSGHAQQLILATDDDREGEAMAWHLLEVLNQNSYEEPPIRVRFTEITRKAIVDAIENYEPHLRDNLVQAQETRRILDRLAGFTLSPILAKKIVSRKDSNCFFVTCEGGKNSHSFYPCLITYYYMLKLSQLGNNSLQDCLQEECNRWVWP